MTPSRRLFLHAVPVVATASVLPVSMAASGCGDDTLQALLSAIELAKQVFTIVEEISGLFVANNPSGSNVNLEIATNLRNGQNHDQVVDSMSCVAKLPANSGLMEIAWCAGFLAKEVGSHLVDAQEGGNPPVKSDAFNVVMG